MIDERFSTKNFEKRGWSTKESRSLAEELSVAIQEDLHGVLKLAFEAVIGRLNLLGHNLKPYGTESPGDYHYRELFSGNRDKYKFLVALDTIVTVGYPETTNFDEVSYLNSDI